MSFENIDPLTGQIRITPLAQIKTGRTISPFRPTSTLGLSANANPLLPSDYRLKADSTYPTYNSIPNYFSGVNIPLPEKKNITARPAISSPAPINQSDELKTLPHRDESAKPIRRGYESIESFSLPAYTGKRNRPLGDMLQTAGFGSSLTKSPAGVIAALGMTNAIAGENAANVDFDTELYKSKIKEIPALAQANLMAKKLPSEIEKTKTEIDASPFEIALKEANTKNALAQNPYHEALAQKARYDAGWEQTKMDVINNLPREQRPRALMSLFGMTAKDTQPKIEADKFASAGQKEQAIMAAIAAGHSYSDAMKVGEAYDKRMNPSK